MKINKQIRITPQLLITLSMAGLLLLQVISYLRAEWVVETNMWSNIVLVYKYPYSNKVMEIVRFSLLFVILIATLALSRHDTKSWIYVIALTGFAVIYSVEAIVDIGLSSAMYSGNLPIMYMLVTGFLIGQKEDVWTAIKKLFLPFMIIYAVLFAFEFFDSYLEFGWVIYQNSSMMTYYAHLFWFSVAYIYGCITEGKRKVLIYPILIILFIGAILLRSRSWVIQAALLILITSFTMYRQKKKSVTALLKGLIVVGIIAIVAAVLLNTYFKPFVDSLLEKGDTDSRSFQYIEMLEQVEPYKWLFGQGMTATYVSSLYGEYTFIDNEFFYMSFHYGIFFALIYFVPYVLTIIKCARNGEKMQFWLFSALMVLLWVASVNGLSVYNRIHLDIKSFIMPFLAGHIYQIAKDSAIRRSE